MAIQTASQAAKQQAVRFLKLAGEVATIVIAVEKKIKKLEAVKSERQAESKETKGSN